MSAMNPPSLERLVDQIQTESQKWFAPGVVLNRVPELIVRKWSIMLRFLAYSGNENVGAVLVKITHHQGGSADDIHTDKSLFVRTQREFEMLRSVERIFSATAEQGFCFIRPLATLEEWNALITEELTCKPLKSYLLDKRMFLGRSEDWQQLEQLLERSARWLAIYHHGMGEQESKNLQSSGLRLTFAEHLEQLAPVLTTADNRRLRHIMGSIFEKYPALPVPMAVLHGDFHCSNLLITPDLRVGSLDAESMPGPIYEDLAKLLADLETRSLQLFTFGLLIPSQRMARCRAAVVKGYFSTSTSNPVLLELFIVLALLYKWKIDEDLLVHSKKAQRLVRILLSPARRWYMSRIVNRHLDVLALDNGSLLLSEKAITT